jgi:diaminohydroxyphosphoribosylaminopyrimidine deaminase/5-amino-6-(5-phosphoribosylamino)uracil reductase
MNQRESLDPDEFFMRRCLDLAANGLEKVAPNPVVGAVVVYKGMAIGEGFHQAFGGPHAEVNAIRAVGMEELLPQSTLYVNLEPCAHSGKTPPCTSLIIEKKIPRVVIGTSDPNSLVAGRGIQKLREAGVEVNAGILDEECLELNRRFFTFHEKQRPYIILKWARTRDGFIDIVRSPETPVGVNRISNELSQMLVHKWRAQEQAVLVGRNTVLFDDPQLTVRHWKGNNPVRILLDRDLTVTENARIFDDAAPTIIYNLHKNEQNGNREYVLLDKQKDQLEQILSDLYRRNILSVIVEGGKQILEQFITRGFWDEARVFVGDKNFNRGIHGPALQAALHSRELILNDQLLVYRNQSPA